MSKIMFIIVLITFACDMFFTFRYIKCYKEMYPNNDWTQAEANPLLRVFMKSCGLENGMIYGALTIAIMLMIIMVISAEEWSYFLFGLYFATNGFHLANWNALKRIKQSKGGKKDDK